MVQTCLVAASEHGLLRTLKRVMEPSYEVVGMIDNAASLVESIRTLEPNLVVIDLDLLRPSPERTLTVLGQHAPGTPVIGLCSELDDDENKLTLPGLARVIPRRLAGQDLVNAAQEALAV